MSVRIIKPDLKLVESQFRALRPAGGFSVIHIDSPWLFQNFSEAGEEKNAIAHYPCMETEDIMRLPLQVLAADDCAVFSWHTWPMMKTWARVIDAWGFDYAGLAWEWLKFNPETGKYAFGPGYGTRKNVEPCLLLTRGDPKLRPGELEFFGNIVVTGSRSVRDFILEWPADAIRAPRREHSRKPDEAWKRIETMFEGPYVELFARTRRKGWKAWGNELDKFEVAA
jgi:N6-adenosine-specific RNA methylase IME4